MDIPMANPTEEARDLKAKLTKVIADFAERTNYMVKKIEIVPTVEQHNVDGRPCEKLVNTWLRRLIVQSKDGTRVEV